VEKFGSLTGPFPPSLSCRTLENHLCTWNTYNLQNYIGVLKEIERTLLTVSAGVVSKEAPEIVEFNQLKSRTTADALTELVGEFGLVYVTAITRQGCSGCETQKPLFKTLAEKMEREYPETVRFRRLHINYNDDDKRESWNSKRIFGHAAYPTYMIHVKSHVGPLELYRSVYPPMEELEKQIKESFDLAQFYKAEAETVMGLRAEKI
jgi:hypothetical protein